ncbi:hypothetical protein FOMPIDRAFT_1024854 [Fomitopsis schrenkii]|uniref:Uncharacterized protein n=1 Tax=Fomitopsis schrenkii TaxID=2126942 RepID=S8DY10_FOMSC|nr:hypothetical protein FOMPIDRAFT_1024854 [Fomitopsis schrenkii]
MGMQSMQYGGPPGYYPEQSQPLIQGQLQPPYEQPQYPTPAHNPYEPHAGFAPPYQAQAPLYSPPVGQPTKSQV